MKKIRIQHRETGEYIYAFKDDHGCITLPNGHTADPYFWAEVDTWGYGFSIIVLAAFVIYAVASAISYYTATDERKFMRECMETAKEQECISQWFVMQRDK